MTFMLCDLISTPSSVRAVDCTLMLRTKRLRVRSRGRVVRAFGCGAEGRWLEFCSDHDWKTLIIHPAVNGYLINFRVMIGSRLSHAVPKTRWGSHTSLPRQPLG